MTRHKLSNARDINFFTKIVQIGDVVSSYW